MLRGNLGKNWGTPIPEIAQTFLAGGLQRRNLDSSQGFILIDLVTNLRNIPLTGCASPFSLWTIACFAGAY
jgi:hypothetical protein